MCLLGKAWACGACNVAEEVDVHSQQMDCMLNKCIPLMIYGSCYVAYANT